MLAPLDAHLLLLRVAPRRAILTIGFSPKRVVSSFPSSLRLRSHVERIAAPRSWRVHRFPTLW
jgi:hypothetical protein